MDSCLLLFSQVPPHNWEMANGEKKRCGRGDKKRQHCGSIMVVGIVAYTPYCISSSPTIAMASISTRPPCNTQNNNQGVQLLSSCQLPDTSCHCVLLHVSYNTASSTVFKTVFLNNRRTNIDFEGKK